MCRTILILLVLMGCSAPGPRADGGTGDGAVDQCEPAQRCRFDRLCCEAGEECVDGLFCHPVCANERCGDNGEICCGDDQICLEEVVCAARCTVGEALCGVDSDTCCAAGDVCLNDTCVTPGAECTDDFDCRDPALYCDPSLGRCLPSPADIMCEDHPPTSAFALVEEWHWTGVTIGAETFEGSYSTPMVGDVSGDGVPDVIVHAYPVGDQGNNVLVAISGDDGRTLWTIGPTRPAIRNEGAALVNFDADDALEVAYCDNSNDLRVVDGDGRTILARRDDVCAGRGSIEVADLNGDGRPDFVMGCNAVSGADISDPTLDFFKHGGCPVAFSLVIPSIGWSLTNIGDLDDDGKPEVTSGGWAINMDGSFLWRIPGDPHGLNAIADIDADGHADVVVVRRSEVTVRRGADGEVILGPIRLAGDGLGGAPVVADFDGDGMPEIGAAALATYSVIDPDCADASLRPGGFCGGTMGNPILWQMATQDVSSSVTGSSVFDFEGDGVAEVIYNDECWLRVYDGRNGAVLVERPNSSRTILEYPVVADVDGDGNSEIVFVANRDTFATRDDCRTAWAEHFGVAPSALPPEFANGTTGVFSVGDAMDRWVPTRPIWNQYSYHVTNVDVNGRVPATEPNNWSFPGLNNYRQNVQGAGIYNAPDLVAELDTACGGEGVTLSAVVSNRGSRGVAPGVVAEFYRVQPAPEQLVGTAMTTAPLLPGGSERVTVTAEAPGDVDLRFEVRVRLPSEVTPRECDETNNSAAADVRCPGLI